MKLTHNNALQQARAYCTPQLHQRATELFLIAVATGFHRGLTPLSNYYAFRDVPEHEYRAWQADEAPHRISESGPPCNICSLMAEETLDEADTLDDFKIGRTHLYPCYEGVLDLQEIHTALSTPPERRKEWQNKLMQPYRPEYAPILSNLLHAIENAPNGETSGALEKRLSKEKVLPKSNKASRLWCVRILAQLGIIPCKSCPDFQGATFFPYHQYFQWEENMFSQFPLRADPVFPMSLWRGGDGIDWRQAERIFPQLKTITVD